MSVLHGYIQLQLLPASPCLMGTRGCLCLCFQSPRSLSFNLSELGPTLHAPCIPHTSRGANWADSRPGDGGGRGLASSFAGFEFQRCTSVPPQRVWFKCRGDGSVHARVYTGGSCVPVRIPSGPSTTLITWAALMPSWLRGICCPWGCTYVRSDTPPPYRCFLIQQRASWLATRSHLFTCPSHGQLSCSFRFCHEIGDASVAPNHQRCVGCERCGFDVKDGSRLSSNQEPDFISQFCSLASALSLLLEWCVRTLSFSFCCLTSW